MRSLLLPFLLLVGAAALGPLPLRADGLALSVLSHPKADHLAIGLHVKAPGFEELVIEFPQIVPEGQGSWDHPLSAQIESSTASASVPYASGARFTYTVRGDDSVLCTYSGVPAGTRGLWFPMMIPVSFADGGRYGFGAPASLSPFPFAPGNRSVESGRSGPFTLVAASGAGIVLTAPSDRQGITDFRPTWSAFSWTFSYLLKDHPENGSLVLHASSFAPLEKDAR